MPLPVSRRESLIGACPLFHALDAAALAALAEAAVEVEFPAGRTIAREGEVGTGLFVIAEGSVRVVRDGVAVAHLGTGDFFGELSVLDGGPRIAAVITDQPTGCLAIATWDLERVLRDHPGAALAVLRVVAARLREASTDHRS
jgi:CRP/FNR family transcriptional regulator, cyclic AMP receptor protein